MKSPNRTRSWKGMLTLMAMGMLHAASCSSEDLRAVVVGLSAAANVIENQDSDISFSDWLASELQD